MDTRIHPHRKGGGTLFWEPKRERSMFFPRKLPEFGAKIPTEDSSNLESGRAVSDVNIYELTDSYCMLHR